MATACGHLVHADTIIPTLIQSLGSHFDCVFAQVTDQLSDYANDKGWDIDAFNYNQKLGGGKLPLLLLVICLVCVADP